MFNFADFKDNLTLQSTLWPGCKIYDHTMLNFQKLSLLFLFTLLLFQPVNVIAKSHYCMQKCGEVHIQFPFYLRNNTFNHTKDYPPGFALLCTEKHETVLELPSVPIKLYVRNIDYKSQQIQIYDPQNCLPSHLLKLGNASISPFQFSQPHYSYDFETNVSFFRCDSMSSCPILILGSDDYVDTPVIVSCTKLKDFLFVQWSVKWDFDLSSINYETAFIGWSKPNCSYCEAHGQKCKWKNGTKGETECFVCPTNTIPNKIIVLIAAGGIVGLMLLLLLVKALFHVYDSWF